MGATPAGASLSFASPKESKQRKGDPAVRDPAAAQRGNLRCSRRAGAAQTRLRLKQRAALIRPALRFSARPEGAVEARTAEHPYGPSLRLAQHPRGKRQTANGKRHMGHGIRHMPHATRTHTRRAAPVPSRPSAAMARMDVWGCFNPLWLRLCRGACRVAGVPQDTPAAWTDSPWLSERSAAGAQ